MLDTNSQETPFEFLYWLEELIDFLKKDDCASLERTISYYKFVE
jgi:hypothetical protein